MGNIYVLKEECLPLSDKHDYGTLEAATILPAF